MTARTRLAAFSLALVAALGAGAGLGALAGPSPTGTEGAPHHGEPPRTRVGDYDVTITTVEGAGGEITATVTLGRDGQERTATLRFHEGSDDTHDPEH